MYKINSEARSRGIVCEQSMYVKEEEEEEGFYKFLPAYTADRLCQSWQSCPISDEYVYVYVYVYEGGSTPQKVAASQQCM